MVISNNNILVISYGLFSPHDEDLLLQYYYLQTKGSNCISTNPNSYGSPDILTPVCLSIGVPYLLLVLNQSELGTVLRPSNKLLGRVRKAKGSVLQEGNKTLVRG